MKIVGGSFGIGGKARLSGNYLEIFGDRQAEYKRGQVDSVTVRQEGERKFGFFGAIIGGLILAFILGQAFGPFGWLIGFALAIAGSFYSTKKYFADLSFNDGSVVNLQTNDHECKKLSKFPGS